MTTSIESVCAQINEVFGDGTIRRGNDPDLRVSYGATGVLPLDLLLGGGLPRGRIVEIFGDSSALKSYVGLVALGAVQRAGGRAALVDTEHAYDDEWAKHLGLDTDELLVMQPSTGEKAVGVTELLIRDKYDLIVWDSVAATLPKAYQEAQPGDSADNAPARLAAMMSKACARLNTANSKTTLLCINQTRVNVGMTYGGARESTPGGKALGYYASLRVRFTKAGRVTQDTKTWDGEKWITTKIVLGQKIKMTLEKSKLSSPDRESWFTFNLTTGGVDNMGFLIAQGLEQSMIQSKGAWMTITELGLKAQGIDRLKMALDNNQEAAAWLQEKIMGSDYRLPGQPPPVRRKAARPRAGS